MNILSLFDGMSCGQIALNRVGIKYDNYYASEIDKHAIVVTQANYPNTIQLGDINQWPNWSLPKIDLLIGGSPCQGFSFAGKQLNFEDPRSSLFFKFVDILNHYKPKWFLLENVKMKKQYQDIISQYLGVEPIEINSALVSAQNRKRLYWTNIPNISCPKDANIILKDILESDAISGINYSRLTGCGKERLKALCLNSSDWRGLNRNQTQNAVLIFQLPHGVNLGGFRAQDGKVPAMTTSSWPANNLIINNEMCVRQLTPLECERLQTVPDDYTNHVSKTQRYKMLGNGWTVDVIAHILGHL